MTDLFAPYNGLPGYKRPEAAARAVAPSIRPSHRLILDAFAMFGAMTADELADKIGRSVLYTRPRCSELRAMGLLHPTGDVRRNASNLRAEVMSI